jgi:hypothetical protein
MLYWAVIDSWIVDATHGAQAVSRMLYGSEPALQNIDRRAIIAALSGTSLLHKIEPEDVASRVQLATLAASTGLAPSKSRQFLAMPNQ